MDDIHWKRHHYADIVSALDALISREPGRHAYKCDQCWGWHLTNRERDLFHVIIEDSLAMASLRGLSVPRRGQRPIQHRAR